MRAPRFISIAVRKPDHRILIKSQPYVGFLVRYPWLKRPVFRGVVVLLESMVQGVQALSHSATVASEAEGGEELSTWAIIVSIGSAIALGLGLFVALPHVLTVLMTSSYVTAQSPLFHLLDGLMKMLILVAYVYAIALMKDIHRVFQYHGAEHKSIHAFEAGEELIVENARKHTKLHPRCGTAFLLFLVLISILVFSFVFPVLKLTELSTVPFLNHVLMVAVKIVLMLPVAGLSYELIKYSASHMDKPAFRALIYPGLLLQRLTTREPDDEQLEVALASLRQVLALEKQEHAEVAAADSEVEISRLAEISAVSAAVAEFPEN